MDLNQLTAINQIVDQTKRQNQIIRDRLKRTYRYHDINSISDESVLYDSQTNTTYEMVLTGENYKIFKTEIDDLRDHRTFNCPFQKIPYSTVKVIKDRNDSLIFNSFNSPSLHYLPKATPKTPEAFLFLIDCLFHQDSREYVLDWLANSLHRKNLTYLIIYTKTRGTGKSFFGNVAKALHLNENSFEISQKTLNSQFNGSLRGKTLLVGNELEVRTKEHASILKKFVDEETCYEGKGTDAVTDKQYANIIITTNFADCVNLSEDERRFSIPYSNEDKLVENQKLKELYGTIDNFVEKIKDEYADIFHYLYHREIKHDMLIAHLSAKHAEMREELLTDWQREARAFFETEMEISNGDFVTASKVKEFLDECPDLNKLKIPGKKVIASFFESQSYVEKTTQVKNEFRIYGKGRIQIQIETVITKSLKIAV
jgi:hypothetical protein